MLLHGKVMKNVLCFKLTKATVTNVFESTELVSAAKHGNTETVLHLLDRGADINSRDNRGRTAVMAATHANNPPMVKLLISKGADIDVQDEMKDNPLLYAGAEGLLEVLKLCIDAKANTRITNRYGGTALIPAAERGHIAVIRELLAHTDVDIDHVNNLGWTALLEAVVLGSGGALHTEVVQLLVDHGANVHIGDSDGVTPLEHARRKGYAGIIRILEARGTA
jgi:ankyrin repeat protein